MKITLGEVGTYINGYAFKPSDWGTRGLPIIRIQNLTNQNTVPNYFDGPYNPKFEVNKGDILIAWSGSLGIHIWQKNRALLNQHIFRVEFNKCDIDKMYFYYTVKYNIHKMLHLTHGATMKHIIKSDFEQIVVPYPSLDVQAKISKILNYLEQNIINYRNILLKLELLIKSRFDEVFNLPLVNTPLSKYIKELKSGKSLAGESYNINKVLKTGAVSFDYFNNKEVKNLPVAYTPLENHRVSVGDVIISRMNTAELVGAAGYVWSVDDNVYLPDRLWNAILDENINPIFVWQLLIHKKTKIQIQRIATGTSGSMKNISKQKFLDIKVPWVPINTQNELSNLVCQINKLKFAQIVYN